MKRNIISIALISCAFVGGWMAACILVEHRASDQIVRSENERAGLIRKLRQRSYGYDSFPKPIAADNVQFQQFNASESEGAVTLSYVGGLGNADRQIRVQADDRIFAIGHGVSRKISQPDGTRSADFFRWVLTSGILNYSDAVIELKVDLTNPAVHSGVLDAPDTSFRISFPELGIDKVISLYAPAASLLKTNPDIIEYQLVTRLENEILSFIPKGDPFSE